MTGLQWERRGRLTGSAWLLLTLAAALAVATACGAKDKKVRARETEAGAGGQEMVSVVPSAAAGEAPIAAEAMGGAGGTPAQGDGGAAEAAANAVALALVTGLGGVEVAGTATFTQEAALTTLALELGSCPDGEYTAHIHLNEDCGNEGNAAGPHWIPGGEMLGNFTCANGVGEHSVSKPTSTWTVGGDSSTDVSLHALIIHAGGDPASGARVGCATIEVE